MVLTIIAIVAAAAAAMAVSFAWYAAFGRTWMKLSGIDPKKLQAKKKGVWKSYVLSFAGLLVMAAALDYFISLSAAPTVMTGVQLGALAWLGFVATTGASSVLYEGKSAKLYALNHAHHLVAMVVMAAVLVVL